jgi:hypothetical protein
MNTVTTAFALYKTYGGQHTFSEFKDHFNLLNHPSRGMLYDCIVPWQAFDNAEPIPESDPAVQRLIATHNYDDPILIIEFPGCMLIADGVYRLACARALNMCVLCLRVRLCK